MNIKITALLLVSSALFSSFEVKAATAAEIRAARMAATKAKREAEEAAAALAAVAPAPTPAAATPKLAPPPASAGRIRTPAPIAPAPAPVTAPAATRSGSGAPAPAAPAPTAPAPAPTSTLAGSVSTLTLDSSELINSLNPFGYKRATINGDLIEVKTPATESTNAAGRVSKNTTVTKVTGSRTSQIKVGDKVTYFNATKRTYFASTTDASKIDVTRFVPDNAFNL